MCDAVAAVSLPGGRLWEGRFVKWEVNINCITEDTGGFTEGRGNTPIINQSLGGEDCIQRVDVNCYFVDMNDCSIESACLCFQGVKILCTHYKNNLPLHSPKASL